MKKKAKKQNLFTDEVYERLERTPEESVDEAIRMILEDDKLLKAVKKASKKSGKVLVLGRRKDTGCGNYHGLVNRYTAQRLYIGANGLCIDDMLDFHEGRDLCGDLETSWLKAQEASIIYYRKSAWIDYRNCRIVYSTPSYTSKEFIETLKKKYGPMHYVADSDTYQVRKGYCKLKRARLTKRMWNLNGREILDRLEEAAKSI